MAARAGEGKLTSVEPADVYDGVWNKDRRNGHGAGPPPAPRGCALASLHAPSAIHSALDYSSTLHVLPQQLWAAPLPAAPPPVDHAARTGVMTSADGSTYDGEYKDGDRQGYGTSVSAAGNKYEGEWAHGYRNGQGKLTRADGEW